MKNFWILNRRINDMNLLYKLYDIEKLVTLFDVAIRLEL